MLKHFSDSAETIQTEHRKDVTKNINKSIYKYLFTSVHNNIPQ